MKLKSRGWSEEEDDVLIRLYKQGEPADVIAETVGRSPKAVWNRCCILRRDGRVFQRECVQPWHQRDARGRAVATCAATMAQAKARAVLAPRGYSQETAAWALANAREDREAGLIVIHLAERGFAPAQALIDGRAAA